MADYTLIYTVTTAMGYTESISRTFHVQDTSDPILSLLNPSRAASSPGDTVLVDPDVDILVEDVNKCTVRFRVAGNRDWETAPRSVSMDKPGSIAITYEATDASGNNASIYRDLVWTDTTPSVIGLGASAMSRFVVGETLH